MKRYESMKPSNVLWIGSIPEHWTMRRNITLLTERDERSEQGEEQLLSLSQYTGITIRGHNSTKMGMHEAESLVGYKVVHENDIVMNIMLAWNGSTAKSKFKGIISPAYAVYHLIDDSTNPDYLHYLYKTPYFMQYFEAYSTGLIKSRLRLYPQSFLHLSSIVPPREEQDQIVRFLDWKVSEINRLVNIKKKEIERLEELKKAVVSRAVTRGLRSDMPMKDSGVDWIGMIPEHWEMKRGKALFYEVDRRSQFGEEELLTVSHITGVTPRADKNVTMFKSESLVGYKICCKGDIAANTMWMWQGAIAVSNYDGVISPSYNTYKQKSNQYVQKYLDDLLRINQLVDVYKNLSTGIRKSRLRLYPAQFLTIMFPVPPLEEQSQIVAYLDEQTEQINATITNKQHQIQTLQEFKTRLVSDVVTGKIDVRGIEIPDYEFTAEEADSDSEAEEMEEGADEE